MLFPCDHDATKVMSENTVNSALRVMGYDIRGLWTWIYDDGAWGIG